jgi:predicted esterase
MRQLLRWIALAIVLILAWQTPQGKALTEVLRRLIWQPVAAELTIVERPDHTIAASTSVQYAPPDAAFQKHIFTFEGQQRQFWLRPKQVQSSTMRPVVILLHGTGRDGRAMLDMWRDIDSASAFLIAPDALDTAIWQHNTDGEAYLTAVLAEAKVIESFDSENVSLYGHSAGATMALDIGNCTAFPAKAIVVHAGVFQGCGLMQPPMARRYLIQIGDQDASFPLQLVRDSAVRIAAQGSPVRLLILRGHTHWFYDIGPRLAREAFVFMQNDPASGNP